VTEAYAIANDGPFFVSTSAFSPGDARDLVCWISSLAPYSW
jgi:hypothetical protein